VTTDGGSAVTVRGVCWSASPNPTVANAHTSDGSGLGAFTSSITGLTANTKYYVRSYATNSVGTAYGNEISFTTGQSITSPTVTTNDLSNIAQTTATCGGNVTSDGGSVVTARGVCWSTTEQPTLSNYHTSDGTGLGIFTSEIKDLNQSTTYYLRAYAVNSSGIAYGNQKSFITMQNVNLPIVITFFPNNITMTSAVLGGEVTSEGNTPVTERGVCWSLLENPTVNDNKQIVGSGPGSYETTVQNLTLYTHYYTRAYAINNSGISYGSCKEFTTENNPPPPSDGIIPLSVGNYWVYLPDITSQTVTISITGTIMVQGETCYKWYAQGDQFEWYYLNKSDGCWAYGYNGPYTYPPDLLYKYPALTGDSWLTNWIAVPVQTTMICEGTNLTFDKYNECYKYHFFLPIGKNSFMVTPYEKYFSDSLRNASVNGMVGYDIYQYFIPGIGMVGWETWLQGSKLYTVIMTEYHLNP